MPLIYAFVHSGLINSKMLSFKFCLYSYTSRHNVKPLKSLLIAFGCSLAGEREKYIFGNFWPALDLNTDNILIKLIMYIIPSTFYLDYYATFVCYVFIARGSNAQIGQNVWIYIYKVKGRNFKGIKKAALGRCLAGIGWRAHLGVLFTRRGIQEHHLKKTFRSIVCQRRHLRVYTPEAALRSISARAGIQAALKGSVCSRRQ